MKTEEMLGAHPRNPITYLSVITACINALVECADACTTCADACLGEEMVQSLIACIRVNLDCADICQTTSRILARQTETDPQLLRAQLESCALSCHLCMIECEKHGDMHHHCRICRAVCQNCEKICKEMISRLPTATGVTH